MQNTANKFHKNRLSYTLYRRKVRRDALPFLMTTTLFLKEILPGIFIKQQLEQNKQTSKSCIMPWKYKRQACWSANWIMLHKNCHSPEHYNKNSKLTCQWSWHHFQFGYCLIQQFGHRKAKEEKKHFSTAVSWLWLHSFSWGLLHSPVCPLAQKLY